MNRRVLLLLVTAAVLVTGCRGSDRKLIVTGSSTVAPLILEIGRQYEQEHSGVRIDVQTGGSSRGISDTQTGLADIGMVSRALKGSEVSLHMYAIALDGVALIVHKDNSLTALDREYVVGIYQGTIENWSEVPGGTGGHIVVVNKAEGRATLEVFLEYFKLENRQIHPAVVVGDNEQGIKTVAGNKDGIGYVSLGTAAYDIDHGTPIKLVAIDGVQASLENVRNGSFPISRTLNLVTREPAEGLAKDFIDYVRSERALAIIESQYFVSATPMAHRAGN